MADFEPVRLGVLGTADIAKQVCRALAGSDLIAVAGVGSRSADSAHQFATEFGIPRSFGTYMSLLDDPAIEAIYIPLPNHMHAEWALRALETGKHVLCEKPLAIGGTEVRAMQDMARDTGLVLVEAYPYMAQPQTLRLRQMLAEGTIGRPITMWASFGFRLSTPDGVPLSNPANIRFDPALGGGALLDAGTYCMSLIRLVAGERPHRVRAAATRMTSGVDLSAVATLEFPSGFLAQLSCSMATAGHRMAVISGERGVVQTTFSNHDPSASLELLVRPSTASADPFEPEPTPGASGFLLEAEAFARAIRQGPAAWNGATPAESLDTALALEAIASSLETGMWADLPTD